MKTPGIKSAQEVLKENGITNDIRFERITAAMKAYASQFVREAAENAKVKYSTDDGQITDACVSKDSILSLLKVIENE